MGSKLNFLQSFLKWDTKNRPPKTSEWNFLLRGKCLYSYLILTNVRYNIQYLSNLVPWKNQTLTFKPRQAIVFYLARSKKVFFCILHICVSNAKLSSKNCVTFCASSRFCGTPPCKAFGECYLLLARKNCSDDFSTPKTTPQSSAASVLTKNPEIWLTDSSICSVLLWIFSDLEPVKWLELEGIKVTWVPKNQPCLNVDPKSSH